MHYDKMREISKRVLKERWREGISSYYLYLYEKGEMPSNLYSHFYYFVVNLAKPSSEINYIPKVLRKNTEDEEFYEKTMATIVDQDNLEEQLILKIDLNDAVLEDFLVNNHNNQKWIRLYEIFYQKKLKLDLFEEVIFDYIFIQGLSIRQIAKLTNNSPSWIYRYRKSLIDKIKIELGG